jgi:hypothetical protein
MLATFALSPYLTALGQEQESESFKEYGQEFKGKIGQTYEESVEWYPEARVPKPGTPNVFMTELRAEADR